MNEPKDLGITISKLPTEWGKILLSEEMPVSKVFVIPLIKAVNVLNHPASWF